MLSSFGMDFALKFGGEDQKNKKDLLRKILGYLITFTRSVLLFHRKKAFVVTCFWAKVCCSFYTSTKVYSHLGGTSSDLGGTAQPPRSIGVARIFDWGRAKPKMTCNDIIRSFPKRNFFWDKDIVECMIRSRGLVWHLTKSFQKGERLNQMVKMKICKLGDVCKQTSLLKRITDEGLGPKPQLLGKFFLHFFGKRALLMPLDHISHTFRTI